MEAWLSSFPMIPISLVYSVSGMNDIFMNGGIGGQYLPQYNISADNVTFFALDIDHNDHYYHDPYSGVPRLSLVDEARVIGQIQACYTKKWIAVFVAVFV